MGLINGVLSGVGNLVGGLFGGHQYARSAPAANGQQSLHHSWPGMKKSWPGFNLKDSFNGPKAAPGNSANAPGQIKKGEDHTSADVKQSLDSKTAPQVVTPPPANTKDTTPAANQAPQGPPLETGRKGPAGNDPKINQFNPTGAPAGYDGSEACGPTVGAMVARNIGYGKGMSDAELIKDLGQVAGTTADGTTGNGMIAMYQHMGLDTNATPGANLDWINQQLQDGHHVTALGDYYEVPGRIDPSLTSGHYMDITGLNKDGSYQVNDPANTDLTTMSAAELQKFISSAPQGGFAISAWKPTGAAGTATAPAAG